MVLRIFFLLMRDFEGGVVGVNVIFLVGVGFVGLIVEVDVDLDFVFIVSFKFFWLCDILVVLYVSC